MVYTADLHIHSTASDGQYSPTQLVQLAKQAGIQVMALTDHDTLGGLTEAVQAGAEAGVRVIPGIEMSAREYHTFHILGYGVATENSPLTEACQGMRIGRGKKALRIIDFLKDKGMYIDMDEVSQLAAGSVIGRPHFARIMLEKGYISNYRDAFNLYLDTDEYHERVEISKPPVQECIEKIKGSGGKVVLAHPHQIGIDNDAMDKLVRQLADQGLDGIECYYPKHTRDMTEFYLSLAKKYQLHVTGGSDFHGEKVKPEIKLAQLELELDWLLA